MRQLERKKVQKEEEESVFVTMTDMTISFLLIIMILLAFFAGGLSAGLASGSTPCGDIVLFRFLPPFSPLSPAMSILSPPRPR